MNISDQTKDYVLNYIDEFFFNRTDDLLADIQAYKDQIEDINSEIEMMNSMTTKALKESYAEKIINESNNEHMHKYGVKTLELREQEKILEELKTLQVPEDAQTELENMLYILSSAVQSLTNVKEHHMNSVKQSSIDPPLHVFNAVYQKKLREKESVEYDLRYCEKELKETKAFLEFFSFN